MSMFHGILVPRRVLQRYEAPRGEPSTLHNFTFHVECVPSLSIILLEISILSRYISVAPRTTNCTCIASKICPPPLEGMPTWDGRPTGQGRVHLQVGKRTHRKYQDKMLESPGLILLVLNIAVLSKLKMLAVLLGGSICTDDHLTKWRHYHGQSTEH